MTIYKYKIKSGNTKWRVDFVLKGIRTKQEGFATRSQAKDFEAKERARIAAGGTKIDKQTTLGDYLDWWLSSFTYQPQNGGLYKRDSGRKYRNNNHVRNKQHVTKIKNIIGDVKLHKLRPTHVFLLEKEGLAPTDGSKPIAVSTVRKMQFMLHGSFRDAVREGKLDSNPMGEDFQYAEKVKQKTKFFTYAEYQKILTALNEVEDKRWQIFPYLYGQTGLRKGEIAALQWKDFNLKSEYPFVRISKALEWSQGETNPTVKSPKSTSGEREIALQPETVAKLKAYRIWQAQVWLKSKKKFDDEAPLIFNDKTFGWIQKSVPQQRWRRFLNRIGVEYKSLHKLRHTFASVMGQNGAPPELMRDTLGHSDTRTTLETYTHVFEDKKKEQQLQYMHRG